MDCTNTILGGDRYPSQVAQSKNANALLNTTKEFDLLAVWRQHNPLEQQYTSHCPPHLSVFQTDYIFVYIWQINPTASRNVLVKSFIPAIVDESSHPL